MGRHFTFSFSLIMKGPDHSGLTQKSSTGNCVLIAQIWVKNVYEQYDRNFETQVNVCGLDHCGSKPFICQSS